MSEQKQTFPSMMARMGDLTYFVTIMSFSDVAKWIKRPEKTREVDSDFRNWLQREIDKTRLSKISKYLGEHKQRFFNAIVVGIFNAEPQWYPVEINSYPNLEHVELNEATKTSMGVLELDTKAEAFPIDGQHRVEAIKEAIKVDESIGKDELCVVFVAHHTSAKGRERTRRLFTTLNKYAKAVSPGEIVALDEDDAFAIATRKIASEYKPLQGLVSFTKTANLLVNDKKGITTTVALYQLMQYLPLPAKVGSINSLKVGPPKSERIQKIYNEHCRFWDLLSKYIKEVNAVTRSGPRKEKADNFRRNGGHLLFRPVGQHAFAKAVREMVRRGHDMEKAIEILSKTEMNLNSTPWVNVLWNPSRNTMLTKYKRLAVNLFLFMAHEKPTATNYRIRDEYTKITELESSNLDDLLKPKQDA